MAGKSVGEPTDQYEHYNYEDDKIDGFKGGRFRTKKEAEDHHKRAENRTNRVHVGKQVNNEENNREERLKHPSESSSPRNHDHISTMLCKVEIILAAELCHSSHTRL
ncbi:hypothetical protein FGIG_00663 [Fasciola gigantica]|uniref:Nuclear protein 1 n=1 Tax=Fasciola gigantica TaxID=46835 RepID=A0A504Z265_FASGI|nr:hypothetical protein FGIG_00663 [Fasciola gigantica]